MNRYVLVLGAMLLMAAPSVSQDDLAAGQKVFNRCQACHAVGENARNKSGPELNGIVGRPAGTAVNFNYSSAMQTAGAEGLVWTAEDLNAFLEAPKDKVPGTKMAFGGLKKQQDRDNLIAYLATFSADGTAAPQ
ncbi:MULTISPECIES: cytochrome c family protein [Devosia]|uniref:Cytochrome c2 n=1 Tax=Devosia equisanguinis TaxID=2490941 RepID=A0A3S4C972_9HYPH|nr:MULTISPECIES: cytochrome c family protein [Devosia]ODT51031.1 MAG: cytochrome C [Pelagibacterium sp. SCN 63-126]ODU84557.1 MAG: cytochrome C [Pelagibacterium sp. SCN 63-17]OJX44310.1 MAG: cytochrome c family protein [Devosia sp. 63-57]VDS03026.1 Cytochrome c2 [Devosia equisanguinis]